jgi:hypothetical protein
MNSEVKRKFAPQSLRVQTKMLDPPYVSILNGGPKGTGITLGTFQESANVEAAGVLNNFNAGSPSGFLRIQL